MHEAKNFSTYFPVIFCLESGSSVTKNLEAVRPPPSPVPHRGDAPVPLTIPCVSLSPVTSPYPPSPGSACRSTPRSWTGAASPPASGGTRGPP